MAAQIEKQGISVELFNVIENDLGALKLKLEKADAFLLGSPTINRDALKPIWDMASLIDVIKNRGKLCGAFGSYGWSGEAVKMLEERLSSLRLNVLKDGIRVNFVPSEDELILVSNYADEFAKAVLEL